MTDMRPVARKTWMGMVCCVGIAAGVGACGDASGDATLRIELSSAVRSGHSLLPIDTLELALTDRLGTRSFDLELGEDPYPFEETVEPGVVHIEAIARDELTTSSRVTYYGSRTVEVAPLSAATADFVLFPAGVLGVTVIIPSNVALPEKVQTHFVATLPRPDQATDFTAPLREGRLERVLPSGTYEYFGEFRRFDGPGFEQVGPRFDATVIQGEVVEQVLDLGG